MSRRTTSTSEAIEQLQAALEPYDGTLVVVTHDRWFLECPDLDRVIDVSRLSTTGARAWLVGSGRVDGGGGRSRRS